jgi:hypothetical protein
MRESPEIARTSPASVPDEIEVTPEMRLAGARILAAAYEYAGVEDKFTQDVAERIFLEMAAS